MVHTGSLPCFTETFKGTRMKFVSPGVCEVEKAWSSSVGSFHGSAEGSRYETDLSTELC